MCPGVDLSNDTPSDFNYCSTLNLIIHSSISCIVESSNKFKI